jgi:DNA-binding transcriptional LysR family regulator
MARLEVNRAGEMEAFARVVALGGFTPAARDLGMTPSAVSKLIARLETRLGVRLVNRSTRRIELTPEGATFLEHSLRVLADLDEAERSVAADATPRGRVRINSSIPFGLHYLLPLAPRFTQRFPDVKLDITVTDQVIDLIGERADVAIRVGPMRPSQLMARKLGDSGIVYVAAPDYLARAAPLDSPGDLPRHDLISFNFVRHTDEWPFIVDGQRVSLPAPGRVAVSDGESARRLAIAGQGLARLAHYHIGPDLAAGRLVTVLDAFTPPDLEAVHAVYVGHGGQLPARVRAFLDFLVETVDLKRPPGEPA